jgi:hypothetical protein
MKKFQVVFLLLFLVGCSSNQIPPATIPGVVTTPSPLPIDTIVPPTQTLTSIASTPLPVLTSTPLWTPLPTFSSTESVENLRIWMQGVFDCLLPCWGGITPGITNWQEVRQILDQMSELATVNISENVSCDFGGCNGIAWSLYPDTVAEGSFYTKLPENIVHLIHINIQNEGNAQKINLLRNIQLQDVFLWYGAPPMLLFNVETNLAENRFMELILVYPERQFVIKYIKNTELIEDHIVNCGRDDQIELIILDNKEQLLSLDAINNAVETQDLHLDDRYKTVEEATGLSMNSFYDAISEFSDFCISTPVNIWPP